MSIGFNFKPPVAFAPDENAVKIVEMTAKHLEYYTNFFDKASAGF